VNTNSEACRPSLSSSIKPYKPNIYNNRGIYINNRGLNKLYAGFGSSKNTKDGDKKNKKGKKGKGQQTNEESLQDVMSKRRSKAHPPLASSTFPPLNEEAQKSLISVDPSLPPPTKEQVSSIAKNVYGFPSLDATRVQVVHFDPLVLTVPDFFTEEECGEYIAMSNGGIKSPTVGNDEYSRKQRTSGGCGEAGKAQE